MLCKYCGREIRKKNAKLCPYCGRVVSSHNVHRVRAYESPKKTNAGSGAVITGLSMLVIVLSITVVVILASSGTKRAERSTVITAGSGLSGVTESYPAIDVPPVPQSEPESKALVADDNKSVDETPDTSETTLETADVEPVETLVDIINNVETDTPDTSSAEDYDFNITDGVAVITGYHGTSKKVTVPSTVEQFGETYKIRTIAANAFEGNQALEELIIPASITQIGECAFKNCTYLRAITIYGDIGDKESKAADAQYDRYTKYTVFYNAGANAESLTVTFGEGVTYVPAYLFASGAERSEGDYAHVTQVILSSTVKTVNPYAFYRCYDLNSLIMNDGLTEVGNGAFGYCESLGKIRWSNGLRSIGSDAFAHIPALTELILPENLTYIQDRAFEACTMLEKLVLPASVTSLGDSVFKNCTKLREITINGDIGDHNNDSVRTSGYFGRKYWDSSVFYNAGANTDSLTVTFGRNVTYVPAYLFATGSEKSEGYYAHITQVNLSNTVKEVHPYAFYNCYDLKTVRYTGTEAGWRNLAMSDGNDVLIGATVSCAG